MSENPLRLTEFHQSSVNLNDREAMADLFRRAMQPLPVKAMHAMTPQKLAAEKRKKEQQERIAFPFGRVPSEIVKAFIRFDSHQQHLHSWHELQDCLEMLRKVEAENDAQLERLTARARELEAENQEFRDRMDEAYWRNAD